MKRIPSLPVVGVLSVTLIACLLFLWSQSSKVGRLRDEAKSQRQVWSVEKSELERDVETAQNQALLFSSRLTELQESLRRSPGSSSEPQPEGGSPACELRHQELQSRIGELKVRLEAATSGDAKRAADNAALQEEVGKQAAALAALREEVKNQGAKQAADLAALGEQLAKQEAALAALGEQVTKLAAEAGAPEKAELASLKSLVEKGLADTGTVLQKTVEDAAALKATVEKQGADTATALQKSAEDAAALKATVETQGAEAAAARQKLDEDLGKLEKDVAEIRRGSASTAEERSRAIASLKARLDELFSSWMPVPGPRLPIDSSASPPGGNAPLSDKSSLLRVEAVNLAKALVVVRGGSEAGLREGQILDVLRDGRRLAQIRIIRLAGNMAGAKVLNVTPGEEIRIGDTAKVMVSSPEDPKPGIVPMKIPPPPPPGGGGAEVKGAPSAKGGANPAPGASPQKAPQDPPKQ